MAVLRLPFGWDQRSTPGFVRRWVFPVYLKVWRLIATRWHPSTTMKKTPKGVTSAQLKKDLAEGAKRDERKLRLSRAIEEILGNALGVATHAHKTQILIDLLTGELYGPERGTFRNGAWDQAVENIVGYAENLQRHVAHLRSLHLKIVKARKRASK